MGRTKRALARLLTVLLVGAEILTVTANPAAASDAGRNCGYFYSSGAPNSAWYFEVCVKLVHDTNLSQWWATAASVRRQVLRRT